MFVMDYYGHKLSNGVLFAHHLILDAPGGSSHLGYRRRVPPGHYPNTGVKQICTIVYTGDQYATARMTCYQSSWLAYRRREVYVSLLKYYNGNRARLR